MIKFKTLRWKNFLSTGNVYTEIQLDRSPSTVIVGENGSGKSTLLDALCWVLFNKPFRNIRMLQLINSINGKDCRAEVEFTIGNIEYKVVRAYKPTTFEIYKNGKLLPQPGNNKEYQQQLEDTVLKLNYKSFTQIVVLGNASFTPFMQLSTRDRREVIEDLLDIQIFSKMNVLLRDRLSSNKSEITDVDYHSDLTEEKINIQNQYISRIQQDLDNQINEKKAELKQYKEEYFEADAEREDYQKQIDSLMEKLSTQESIKSKMDKLTELKGKLHDKTLKAEKRIAFFENHDHCPTCEQGICEDVKHEKLEKTRGMITQASDALTELNDRYETVATQMDELVQIQLQANEKQQKVNEIFANMKQLERMAKKVDESIKKMESESNVDQDAGNQLKKLEKELKLLEGKKEELLYQREVLEIASTMLKDGGIKTKIIKQYVPIMNKLVNKYLSAMDFFVNFELDEEFSEVIKSRFRDEFSYASFSEGEKMRIDLALLFTWRAIAKLKNSANTNLLILDEVFDASLDTTGCDEFLKLLNEMSGETNVFVISHKGDVLADKFRSQIRFEKVKNFSRIAA